MDFSFHFCCLINLNVRDQINFFPSFISIIMDWILQAIVTPTAMEKMTIMATGGGVYIVTATKNKKKTFYLT